MICLQVHTQVGQHAMEPVLLNLHSLVNVAMIFVVVKQVHQRNKELLHVYLKSNQRNQGYKNHRHNKKIQCTISITVKVDIYNSFTHLFILYFAVIYDI